NIAHCVRDLNAVAHVVGAHIGEYGAGDDVGNSGPGTEREKHAKKNGNALKRRGTGARQIGKYDHHRQTEDNDTDQLGCRFRPIGVKAADSEFAFADLKEDEAVELEDVKGDERNDDDEEEVRKVGDKLRPQDLEWS